MYNEANERLENLRTFFLHQAQNLEGQARKDMMDDAEAIRIVLKQAARNYEHGVRDGMSRAGQRPGDGDMGG